MRENQDHWKCTIPYCNKYGGFVKFEDGSARRICDEHIDELILKTKDQSVLNFENEK